MLTAALLIALTRQPLPAKWAAQSKGLDMLYMIGGLVLLALLIHFLDL
jgi:hypothetical protein